MRPIDADALLEELNKLNTYTYTKDINGGKLTFQVWGVGDVGRLITKMPTVERPRGEWIKPTVINGKAFSICHCSACGGVPCGVDENTKFCPNCGADMRGEGD